MRTFLLAFVVLSAGCGVEFPTSGPRTTAPLAPADVPRVCGVHKIPLDVGVVPIEYGLPVPPTPRFAEASAAEFPEAHARIEAGSCFPGPNTHQRVRFCKLCRDAERAYRAVQAGT